MVPKEWPNSCMATANTLARYFDTERSSVVQISSASKWTSPPRPLPGKKACARTVPYPSNGYPS